MPVLLNRTHAQNTKKEHFQNFVLLTSADVPKGRLLLLQRKFS